MFGNKFAALVLGMFLMTTIANAESVNGQVEFGVNVPLVFGVDGIVNTVTVGAGAMVLPGTLLASLSTESLQAAYDAAESRLKLIEATQAESARAYERDQVLFDDGSLSSVELAKSELVWLDNQAAVADARANVALAKSNLHKSKIFAPVAGMPVQINIAKGTNWVGSPSGKPAIRFAGGKKVVRTFIDNKASPGLVLDQTVSIQWNGKTQPGVVRVLNRKPGRAMMQVTVETSAQLPEIGTAVVLEY